jgi:hypothetical protein
MTLWEFWTVHPATRHPHAGVAVAFVGFVPRKAGAQWFWIVDIHL